MSATVVRLDDWRERRRRMEERLEIERKREEERAYRSARLSQLLGDDDWPGPGNAA